MSLAHPAKGSAILIARCGIVDRMAGAWHRMGRNKKWISGSPDDATEKVARRVLSARLERVWHYLGCAVEERPSETENVHQLRVFSRRTAAALEIFTAW